MVKIARQISAPNELFMGVAEEIMELVIRALPVLHVFLRQLPISQEVSNLISKLVSIRDAEIEAIAKREKLEEVFDLSVKVTFPPHNNKFIEVNDVDIATNLEEADNFFGRVDRIMDFFDSLPSITPN